MDEQQWATDGGPETTITLDRPFSQSEDNALQANRAARERLAAVNPAYLPELSYQALSELESALGAKVSKLLELMGIELGDLRVVVMPAAEAEKRDAIRLREGYLLAAELMAGQTDRSSEAKISFLSHLLMHPEQRLWQALRNWSGYPRIVAIDRVEELTVPGAYDTFHWESRRE